MISALLGRSILGCPHDVTFDKRPIQAYENEATTPERYPEPMKLEAIEAAHNAERLDGF